MPYLMTPEKCSNSKTKATYRPNSRIKKHIMTLRTNWTSPAAAAHPATSSETDNTNLVKIGVKISAPGMGLMRAIPPVRA
jgi:hypothetical protein